jgi:hypothetical protein
MGGTQVLKKIPVILGASNPLLRERRPVAELLKVPCPVAKAPSPNFRSGNEGVVAGHRYTVLYASTARE